MLVTMLGPGDTAMNTQMKICLLEPKGMGNYSPGHSLNKDFQVQKLAKGIQLVRGRDRIRTQASLQEPSSLKTTGGLGAWEEPNPTL